MKRLITLTALLIALPSVYAQNQDVYTEAGAANTELTPTETETQAEGTLNNQEGLNNPGENDGRQAQEAIVLPNEDRNWEGANGNEVEWDPDAIGDDELELEMNN